MGDQDHKRPEDAGTSPDRSSPYPYEYPEDEISLVDLWLVLARRKWTIIGTTVLVLAAGVGYTFIKEPEFRYTTVIELAHIVRDDGINTAEPIESTKAVQTYIQEVLLPNVRREIMDQRNDPTYLPPEAEVVVWEGSEDMVKVSSDGKEGFESDISKLHRRLLENVISRHNRIVSLEQEKIKRARNLVLEELRNIEKERDWLQSQIEDIEQQLTESRTHLLRAPPEATDEARAMTQLIIQSHLNDLYGQLASLNERLELKVPERQDILNKKLADLESVLQRFRPTEAQFVALRSERPIGTGSTVIAGLSLILGVMLGVFAAFFREFLANVQKAAESSV